jgi:hypothetical protein
MTTATAQVLAALLALPTYREDVADPRKPAQIAALAHEIAELKPPAGVNSKDWRALVIAVGQAESNFSLRIMEGRCKPFECDRGRARSAWQMHKNKHTAPVWDELHGFETLRVQVQTADGMLKRAYYMCERSNPEGFWAAQTILAYAGRGCVDKKTIEPWRGLELRLEYWRKAWRAMK